MKGKRNLVILKLNDKYTVIYEDDSNKPFIFKALRYGEEWRDLRGDNLIFSLVQHIQRLENKK